MSSIRVEQDLMKQAVVLSALFEAAEHHCKTPHERFCKECDRMSIEQAKDLLQTGKGYVGEWCGRKLYLDFSEGEWVRTDNYNRVNGTSRAQRVLDRLKRPVTLTTKETAAQLDHPLAITAKDATTQVFV